MKTKVKVVGLLAAVFLLSAYVSLRLHWESQQPVSFEDIIFAVAAQENEINLKLWHNYYNNKEYLFLPSFCGGKASAQIIGGGWAGKIWDEEPFADEEQTVSLTAGEHTLHVGNTQFTVVVMYSSKVPALFLTTQSGSLDHIEAEKGNGEPGLYQVIAADGTVSAAGAVKKLKSRGNATFLEDKKPYQMTLEESVDLLGNGAQDKYILLANRQDQSLLRDRIMYDLSGDLGLDYSPVSMFVDLYVNNEYRGSYQISEKVETGHGRVDINTDTVQEKTGFLITLEYPYEDRLAEADYYFTTTNGQNVVVKRPAAPTPLQFTYIADTFQEMENGIRAGTFDEGTMDLTSFARKYLIEEIGKNLDAMYSSQYFYREAAGQTEAGQTDSAEPKIYAGPVWDYDKTLGNPIIENTRPVNFQEPRGIFAAKKREDASWWYDLYQIPRFREKVIEEFETMAIPAVESMLAEGIDSYRDEIWDSAYMDYMRWDTFEDFKREEELEFAQEYEAEIERIREFLRLRMEFLSDIWLEGRTYDLIVCDPGEGVMHVTEIDAVGGRTLHEPRDPKWEGYRFDHWVREDTGEVYDFTEPYDGVPFVLKAVYRKEEEVRNET